MVTVSSTMPCSGATGWYQSLQLPGTVTELGTSLAQMNVEDLDEAWRVIKRISHNTTSF